MEPLFINNFKQSKDIIIEMNKAYTNVSRCVFQIAVVIVYAIITYVLLLSDNYIGAALMGVLGVFLFFYPLINIRNQAKKREKQFVELLGEMPSGQNFFYDDYLVATSITDKSEVKIEYEKIIKVKQSKNLYLLVMKQKIVIMVDKNKFEKGNCKEFEQFIRAKAVNAKIKI